MPTKCHVCGKLTRKPLEIPVCGDPSTKISVCSKRCRDEYLAGYVETRKGRTFRLLSRPGGPGIVLAVLWAFDGVVHLLGGPLGRVVAIPLLPSRPGPEFYTAGIAALVVAFALVREARWARLFSAGLAGVGLLFAVLSYARTGHLSYVAEGVTVFPAILLLSFGDPRPWRALVSLGLFGLWPAVLVVTAFTGMASRSEDTARVAAEAYPGPTHADRRVGLQLMVPEGWYILKEESRLLPHDGALFRAVRPEGSVTATVYDRPECDPVDPDQMLRVLRGISADGVQAGLVGDPRALPVASALGEGRSFFVGLNKSKPQLWYVVFLPWTGGRCVELRCGGSAAAEAVIRSDCVELGARAVSPVH